MWRHLLVCVAMVAMVVAKKERWESYKKSFGLSFEDDNEEARKITTFLENVKAIEKHNFEADLGKHTYWQGVNKFTHMTDEEYRAEVIGNCLLDINTTKSADGGMHEYHPHKSVPSEVPAEMDWSKKGYVTPVKNQGQCGSCYSFSATGALEGAWFKKTGKLVSFSEQQIVDCSFSWFGNKGCMGGWYQWAWQYLQKAGGSMTEQDYPYHAVKEDCKFKKEKVVAQVKGYHDLRKGDENQLKEALATVGPVSVAIDAGRSGFRSYKSGVYYDWWCSTWKLNHAVLAVGYGTEDGKDYWLVKNSWGPGWGANGYIKMARNKGNACGIATYASYPIV